MVRLGLLCGQNRQGASEIPHKINLHVLSAVSDRCLAVQPADIPDAIRDRFVFENTARTAVDALTQFPVGYQKEAHLRDAAPTLRDQIGKSERGAGFLQRFTPFSVQSPPQVVGQSTEGCIHVASGQSPNRWRAMEVQNDQTQRA